MRLEPHATGGGKMLLSGVADAALRAWLERHPLERYTPHTITEPARLLDELARIRSTGHALDNEERLLGAACVAVGVRNHLGELAAAMSVAGPAVRFEAPEREMALQQLKLAAAELSAALGYSASPGK